MDFEKEITGEREPKEIEKPKPIKPAGPSSSSSSSPSSLSGFELERQRKRVEELQRQRKERMEVLRKELEEELQERMDREHGHWMWSMSILEARHRRHMDELEDLMDRAKRVGDEKRLGELEDLMDREHEYELYWIQKWDDEHRRHVEFLRKELEEAKRVGDEKRLGELQERMDREHEEWKWTMHKFEYEHRRHMDALRKGLEEATRKGDEKRQRELEDLMDRERKNWMELTHEWEHEEHDHQRYMEVSEKLSSLKLAGEEGGIEETSTETESTTSNTKLWQTTMTSSGGFISIADAGIHLEFPEGSLKHPSKITCYHVKDESKFPELEENQQIVSSVVEVHPMDCDLQFPVTLEITHATQPYQGMEVVVKQLVGNEWIDLKTTCLSEESAVALRISSPKLHQFVPVAHTEVSRFGRFAVVSQLKTQRFKISPQGSTCVSAVLPQASVSFPEGAVTQEADLEMKVQILPNLNTPEGILAHTPIIYLKINYPNDFNCPATVTLPWTTSTTTENRNVLILRKPGQFQQWENITGCLDTVFCNEILISFQVRKFCSFLVTQFQETAATVLMRTAEEAFKVMGPILLFRLKQALQPRLYPGFWPFYHRARQEIVIYMAAWGQVYSFEREAERNQLERLSTTPRRGISELPDGEVVLVNLAIGGQVMEGMSDRGSFHRQDITPMQIAFDVEGAEEALTIHYSTQQLYFGSQGIRYVPPQQE